MDAELDVKVLAAADQYIGGQEAADVIQVLYRRPLSDMDETFNALVGLIPIEPTAAVQLVSRLNISDLQSVVILLAALRKSSKNDGWVHYNLCKYLGSLAEAGVSEAKLPAIVHSLLSLEGLKDDLPVAKPLPLGVLARELASFAPREALRHGVLAAQHGHSLGLHIPAEAFQALGLEAITGRPTIGQMLQLTKALHLSSDHIPQTTGITAAAGVRSTTVKTPRRVTFPPVLGDASHYIFRQAEHEISVPGITVYTLEGGTFSISAVRGLEQHYVYDRNGDCVLDFVNGSGPFVSDTVLECDGPVAILDDAFSGAMNVCHFLLDKITRIPLYEHASAKPCKFFIADSFRYYMDIFDRIGVADRIITPSSAQVSVRAPELLLSSNIAADFRHPAHYCADWAVNYLRRILGIEERQAHPGRKLLISRADTRGRAILNWDEVVAVFHRRGFEVVELGGLSTDAQIALFRDAAQVVGVHGAGLTNILFAPRDCAVLEIVPPMVAVPDYWLLASSLGQRYSAIIADDPDRPRPNYETWRHNAAYNSRDVVMPVERLELALAQM